MSNVQSELRRQDVIEIVYIDIYKYIYIIWDKTKEVLYKAMINKDCYEGNKGKKQGAESSRLTAVAEELVLMILLNYD